MMGRTTDLIKTSPDMWDLFTLRSEYAKDALRDVHDRYVISTPPNDRDLRAPVSRFLKDKGYEPEYPDGKKFSVVLTHDVDSILPSKKRAIISTLRNAAKGQVREAREQLATLLRNSATSPYRRFKEIMDLEERHGGRSTFFFMASGPDGTGAGYPLEDVASDIVAIKARGWEVGLHGGYDAYLDTSVMAKEKAALEGLTGGTIEGYRNHYLRFKTPDTWLALSAAGFIYDSTVGYADRWGFRNGMAMPYRPVDRYSGKEIGLVEMPLAIMDTTFYGYAKVGPSRAWEVTRHLLDEVMQVRGTLVVLWHNDTFGNPKLEGYAKLYEKLLKVASREGGWLCSAGQAAKWWEGHNE